MTTLTNQAGTDRVPRASGMDEDGGPFAEGILDIGILIQSLKSVEKWVEDHDYKGYDPGDGLTSYVRPLACGNLFAERVLQQVVWKFPLNLRPVLGVRPLESTKGRGFMAWGYLLL